MILEKCKICGMLTRSITPLPESNGFACDKCAKRMAPGISPRSGSNKTNHKR